MSLLPPCTTIGASRVSAIVRCATWAGLTADRHAQDEYSIMNSKHFIGIHGYMLVYSVASLQSFEMIQVIREKLLNHLVSFRCPSSPPPPPSFPTPPAASVPWPQCADGLTSPFHI